MFCIRLFHGERTCDYTLPQQEGYHALLPLPIEAGKGPAGLCLMVRCLNNRWLADLPEGFTAERATNHEVALDRHIVLNSPHGKVAIDAMRIVGPALVKYELVRDIDITIGRNPASRLRLDSPLVSDSHGKISFRKGEITYEDNSRNGSYLNGRLVKNGSWKLRVGDVVFIAPSLKMVCLGNKLALSPSDLLSEVPLPPWKRAPLPEGEPGAFVSAMTQMHRSPRLLEKPDTQPVEIEPPISKAPDRDNSLLMTIGPSLTMILPMVVGTMAASMASTTGSFMVAGLAMIGTSSVLAVGWGLGGYKRQRRQEEKVEQRRNVLYRKYIKETEQRLKALYQKEFSRLHKANPSATDCTGFIGTLRLWERMPSHADFLRVRLGLGTTALPNELQVPKQQLSMIDDELRGEPARLVEAYGQLKDVPVGLSLRDEPIVGILGQSSAKAIVMGIIMQVAALQSYHDVKVVILADENSGDDWQWARWLPHVFPTEDRALRMVVSTPPAIREVLTHLEELLQMRAETERENEERQYLPHYVVFCLNPKLLDDEPVLNRLLGAPSGFSLLVAAPQMEQLPKECRQVISAGAKHSGVFSATGGSTAIAFDRLSLGDIGRFSAAIAPMRVRDSVMGAAIPSIVTFLETFGVRDVQHLDVWRFWNENHAYDGLESVIGLRAGAQPFTLDISDKKHGPHGLVAGTTGSGKSVMLQTYILSLALRYHPRDVQFILIDYKGGGMSDAFTGLPHIAGAIDNLAGIRIIRRALASVQGEILRREGIFKVYGVSNVDEYMRQAHMDATMEPIPHLIIVVDEFAELKKEQPEFMSELISASRVGRSVGVHLILATQKPSNSVDDEIWSNARFRICLRVQNRSDSMDMLKRPDASYIKGMGRCYVQIGNDEVFEEVQTSWSGAVYDPNRSASLERPSLLNDAGQRLRIRIDTEKKISTTQMDAVMERVSQVMAQQGVSLARRLWLDELPQRIDMEALLQASWAGAAWPQSPYDHISVPIGLADDLQMQQQPPAMIDLTRDLNHIIVGLAASGKTTFLQTVALALALRYSPEHVQMYVMALTSRTLDSLKELPHVGDIVHDSDPDDVLRLQHFLATENERRRTLFAKASTDNFIAYARSCDSQPSLERVPAIVVLVDRITQLLELSGEEESKQQLHTLLREGSSRGIYFVATALSINELPIRLRDSFHGMALQMRERGDYMDVLGKRVPHEMNDPIVCAGRGIIAMDEALYEMQTAVYQPNATDVQRAAAIRELAGRMDNAWAGKRPVPLARVSKDATWADLLALAQAGNDSGRPLLPCGYRHIDGQPAVADPYLHYAWLVLGNRGSGKTTALKGLVSMLHSQGAEVHAFTADNKRHDYAAFGATVHPPEQHTAYLEMFDELIMERNNQRKAVTDQGEEALRLLHRSFKPYVVVLDGLSNLQLDAALRHRFAECASMATGYGIYLLCSVGIGDLSMLRRDDLLLALAARQNGLALAKLSECDVWDFQVPYAVRSRPVKPGQAHWVHGATVQQLILPKE